MTGTGVFTAQVASVATLGWDGADSKFTGLLGEFAIWPRVLTAAEVAAYYANPYQFLAPSRRVWDVLPTFPSDLARAKGTMRPTVRV
jgi:hypothetical protein